MERVATAVVLIGILGLFPEFARGIEYDEFTNGDLEFPYSNVLQLSIGVNRVRGTAGNLALNQTDADAFNFTVPSSGRLTAVNLIVEDSAGNTGDVIEINPVLLSGLSGAGYPNPTAVFELAAASPGSDSWAGSLPPGGYFFAFAGMGWSGSIADRALYSYTVELTVSAADPPIVDTGIPTSSGFSSGCTWRAAQFTTSSDVAIDSIQNYVLVNEDVVVTVTLRADESGLPGTAIYSTNEVLAAGPEGFAGPVGLNWRANAGTYWVTFEHRYADYSTDCVPPPFSRRLGFPDDGTYPPNPVDREAALIGYEFNDVWSLTGGRTGWRILASDQPPPIVDTGPGSSAGPTWLIGRRSDGIEQSLAAKFQVSEEVEVGSVESWMFVNTPGSFKFSIHSDGGEVPGAELYSGHFTVDEWSPSRWLGLSDLSWRLQPGTYWAAFEGGQLGTMGGGGMPSPSDAPLTDEAGRGNYTTPSWTWSDADDIHIGVRIYEAGASRCTGNWGAYAGVATLYGDLFSVRDRDVGGAYYGDCRTSVAALARDEVLDQGGLVRSLASADIARGVLRLSGELMDRGQLSHVFTDATIRDEIVAHVSSGGTGTLTFTLDVWGELSGTRFGTGSYYENVGHWYFRSGTEIVADGSIYTADSVWYTPSGWALRDQISYSTTVTDGQIIPLEAVLNWQCIAEAGENCSFNLGNSAWLQITGSEGVTFSSASGELLSDPYVPESIARLDLLAESVRSIGPGTSLADKVALARMYFEIPDISSTCSTLQAFMHEVRAQSGKKLDADQASRLIADAQRAWSAVGCQ